MKLHVLGQWESEALIRINRESEFEEIKLRVFLR